MPAQRGRDLLLKIDADGTSAHQTVAGLRSNTISFNAETVDVSHQESAGQWRELLAGAGLRSAAIRGSGIFKDAASDALIRDCFFTGAIRSWQVIIPDFGIVAGPFQIASLEFGGRHDGEVTFELSLESAGLLAFTEA
jgi:TP901-1 family phage major tail protein